MSRFNPHHEHVDEVLEAANSWKNRCLIEDRSVFAESALWSLANLTCSPKTGPG
jgi:hypothetical protein